LTTEVPPEVQHKLMRFQEAQERLRALTIRRLQYEAELRETEHALEELQKAPPETPVYKSVGNLLFLTKRDQIVAELTDKKETLELHIKTLERQEGLAKKQVEELRKDLAKSLSGPSGAPPSIS